MSSSQPWVTQFRSAARRKLLDRAAEVGVRGEILVVAPHPDDETLGCGARIWAARRAGRRVTIVVATDGAKAGPVHLQAGLPATRSAELAEATTVLGVPAEDVIELAYPDGQLERHELQFCQAVVRLIEERSPDVVYVTSRWEPHHDHAVAGRAVRRAVQEAGRASVLMEYPVWLWADWPLSRRVGGRGVSDFLRLSATGTVEKLSDQAALEAKQRALDCYQSQLGPAGLSQMIRAHALTGGELAWVVAGPSGWSARSTG